MQHRYARAHNSRRTDFSLQPWASARTGKSGQLTPPPGKMDENLKNENRQKSSFLNGGGGEGEVIPVMTGWVKLMIIIIIVIIQIYLDCTIS